MLTYLMKKVKFIIFLELNTILRAFAEFRGSGTQFSVVWALI